MASDYFAALMRASGLAAPTAAQPGAVGPATADGIVEEQVVRQSASPATGTPPIPAAPAAAQPEATPPAQGPAMPPAADALPVGPRVPLPAEAAGLSAPGARADNAAPAPLQPRSAGSPKSAAPKETREPRPAPPAGEPGGRDELGPALMRVALNWVHGGARQGASDQTVQLPDGRQPQPPAARADPALPPARAVPAAAATMHRMPALPEAPRAPAVDAVRLAPPADLAPWAGTMAPRGGPVPETLEISIGAIHLRVDAPPVQAVPSPPTPATPGAATPAARPKRGDFERRLLRRL